MEIRPYGPHDRASCLGIFGSLTPALLGSDALPRFEAWLDNPTGPYFVMEHDEVPVGCGGYSLSPDRDVATLRWGMIRGDLLRMGFGRFLLLYRMREIGRQGSVGVVFAQSPRASAEFFEKQGFRVNGPAKDGGAPASDWIDLIKKLTVCP